jgi:ubiquinone/menaquinone biosynthesis C-methylase UbiE
MSDGIKAFDKVAGSYDSWYADAKGRRVFDAERRAVESFLPGDGIGLEIGAGTGIFAESLTDTSRPILCLDVSKEMLTKAKERDVPTILGSAQSLPLRGGSISFAYMITSVEFLADPRRAFEEVNTVLRADSPLVVLFINRSSAWGELYKRMGEKGDPVFSHARLYSEGEMIDMLTSSGLRVSGKVGTLNSGPSDASEGSEITEPNTRTGVIVVRAVKTKIS